MPKGKTLLQNVSKAIKKPYVEEKMSNLSRLPQNQVIEDPVSRYLGAMGFSGGDEWGDEVFKTAYYDMDALSLSDAKEKQRLLRDRLYGNMYMGEAIPGMGETWDSIDEMFLPIEYQGPGKPITVSRALKKIESAVPKRLYATGDEGYNALTEDEYRSYIDDFIGGRLEELQAPVGSNPRSYFWQIDVPNEMNKMDGRPKSIGNYKTYWNKGAPNL